METKEKVFISTQLAVALPPTALKLINWLIAWQSNPQQKLYVKQYAKNLKMSVEDVELAIQTLVDVNLVEISRVDQTWIINLNREQIKKYYKLDLKKVTESDGIKLADRVTWDEVETEKSKPSMDFEDMSEEQLQHLLLRIEASLSEKQQVKKLIKNNVEFNDGLPF